MQIRHTLGTMATTLALAGGAAAQGPATAGLLDGPYAVLGGGVASVAYDCGYSFECERTSSGLARAALGWRRGALSGEAWVVRQASADVGDAWVARTLKLSAIGAVVVFHRPGAGPAEWQWRLGLMQMRHDRTGDGVTTTTSPLVGLAWTTPLGARTSLQLSWDLTQADGDQVSSTILQWFSAGLVVRF